MIKSQSSETVLLASTSQEMTQSIGIALSASLYRKDTTIRLRGELGAGKTTFVRGLGLGLGLGDIVTSPTYALENRYEDILLHLDLYRLDSGEAKRVVDESEEFPGVRAIEWNERVACHPEPGRRATRGVSCFALPQHDTPSINVIFHETSPTARTIEITFADLTWPTRKEIEQWRREVRLPEHITRHCDAVGKCGNELAKVLLKRGTVCRPEAVKAAGELHDLLRFVDFKPNVHKKIPHAKKPDEKTQQHWDALREQYGNEHEDACAAFLEERKYPELATVIRPHGLRSADHPEHFKTTEQKILYYADKRIQYDKVVSLDERFDDFVRRYGDGVESDWARMTREKTKAMEKELFADKPPRL